MKRVKRLTCCACGGSCYGRQWWNRDTGFGLCGECGDWLMSLDKQQHPMSLEEVEKSHGKRGVHWDCPRPVSAADKAELWAGCGI